MNSEILLVRSFSNPIGNLAAFSTTPSSSVLSCLPTWSSTISWSIGSYSDNRVLQSGISNTHCFSSPMMLPTSFLLKSSLKSIIIFEVLIWQNYGYIRIYLTVLVFLTKIIISKFAYIRNFRTFAYR
ncbi:Uncharacterised protein [Segatella copri]|nr:Uncharacterised protein [Segatella copri]